MEIAATQQWGQEAAAVQPGQGLEGVATQQRRLLRPNQNQGSLALTPESLLDATRSPQGQAGSHVQVRL